MRPVIASPRAPQSSIMPVVAVLTSAAVASANVSALLFHHGMGPRAMGLDYVVVFASIILVARTEALGGMRGALVALLLGSLFTLDIGGDFFGLHKVDAKVGAALVQASAAPADASAAPRAVLPVAPADDQPAVDGKAGSARVEFDRMYHKPGEVGAEWTVTDGAARLRCGRITLLGAAVGADALGDDPRVRRALAASARAGRPACGER